LGIRHLVDGEAVVEATTQFDSGMVAINHSLTFKTFNQPENYLSSWKFESEYLNPRCTGCGSSKHGLLAIDLPKTRQGKKIITYLCPMVEHIDPMEINPAYPKDQVQISFHLDVEKYAERCRYNEEIASGTLTNLNYSYMSNYPRIILEFETHVLNLCKRETARFRGERAAESRRVFEETFLSAPCKICGSNEHSMYREEIRGSNQRRYYACPIAYYSDEALQNGLPGTRVFRICPAKLAQECGYVEEALNEHLSVILEKGYGRYLSNQSILKLSSSAREHIREERANWEFKRDNRVVKNPEADHPGNEDGQQDEPTKEG
jgi:hypothetical protein